MVTDGFYAHSMPFPGEWQKRLDRIAPQDTKLSSLYGRWEPGDTWQPVQRFVVWNLRPKGIIPSLHAKSLLGPHPRSTGNYNAKMRRWDSRLRCSIDRATWEVFHETGCYGQRYWVLQGDKGGHKYRLTDNEERLAMLHGKTAAVPAPGDLPFAPLDNRAVDKLADLDVYRAYNGFSDYCARNWDSIDLEEKAAYEKVNEEIWKTLEDQLDSVIAENMGEIKKIRDRVPVLLGDYADRRSVRPDFDQADEDFIKNTDNL